jgi:FtsH-binding integral membrane protein
MADGLRREVLTVLGVGALVVVAVLGVAFGTSLLPTVLQEVVFHSPLLIAVLVGGTAWVLWRIGRRSGPR